MGWSNSTLRYTDELPLLNLRSRAENPRVKGVVIEDPLDNAWGAPLASSPGSHPVDSSMAPGVQTFAERSVLREALARTVSNSTRSRGNGAVSAPKLEGFDEQGDTSRSGSRIGAGQDIPPMNSQTQVCTARR